MTCASAAAQLSLDELEQPRGLTRAELMTASEVAELLSVPVSTVRHWGRDGTLPRVKLGRHVRYLRARIESAIFDAEETRHALPAVPSLSARRTR